jgi:hypothetical protein
MNKVNEALFFALVALLGLDCGGSALKLGGSGGSALGGQNGPNSSGGALGAGGPPIGCPAVTCTNGTVPDRDSCGCPICIGADAGTDTSKLACKIAGC